MTCPVLFTPTHCPQLAVRLLVVFLLALLAAIWASQQLLVLSVASCATAVSRPEGDSAFPMSSWKLLAAQRPFLWFQCSELYSEWLASPNTQFQQNRDTSSQQLANQIELTYWTVYYLNFLFYFLNFFFWPCPTACGILLPWPGIEPTTPAVEAQSLNHWTAREVPKLLILDLQKSCKANTGSSLYSSPSFS